MIARTPTLPESPLRRICREARERQDYVLAHPDEFASREVEAARLAVFSRERLRVADVLRWE